MILLVGVQLLIPWVIRSLIGAVTEQPLDSSTMTHVTRLTIITAVALVVKGVLQFLRSYMAHRRMGVVADVAHLTSTCSGSRCASMRTSRPGR